MDKAGSGSEAVTKTPLAVVLAEDALGNYFITAEVTKNIILYKYSIYILRYCVLSVMCFVC